MSGRAICSGCSIPVSVAMIAVAPAGAAAAQPIIPPVESMWTPSAATSPAATYSMTEVEQPHSGWIRKSAPGCAARMSAMSRGPDAGVDVALAVPHVHLAAGLLLDVGAEEHVRAEQDLGVRAVLA